MAHSRASGGSPCTRPTGSCAPSEANTMPFACRAELRFAAAVPPGCGVLRYAPNALLAADRDCLRALSGAARQAGAEMLVGLVARRPRRAPAGSPHLM